MEITFTKPDGKEIDGHHAQYTLAYCMMAGIHYSAGSLDMFKHRLEMTDYMRVVKREFPANPQTKHSFKFKDYSPDIFRQVRHCFGVDSADYMITLCGDSNYIEFMSNSKSGQFFFYSHDGRFMIKTQTKKESKFLRRILPHYHKFVMDNPNTLVTRFYGMHRVEMQQLKAQMHFVIMASVFSTPKAIHLRFDLKGSKVGRSATAKEKARANPVLKDNDLVDANVRLSLGPATRALFLVQLRKDVTFLQQLNIMDYSLLVGIHKPNQEPTESVGSDHCHTSRPTSDVEPGTPQTPHEPPSTPQTPHVPETPPAPLVTRDRTGSASTPRHLRDLQHESSASPRTPKTSTASSVTGGGSIFCRDAGGMYARTPNRKRTGEIYFVGIIDILQQYNERKIAENGWKRFVYNKNDISAVPPGHYGSRFLEFVEAHVLTPAAAQE
ncbi:Aste57867_11853 [Aphanomyces stellatus]|uniref:Aste57867_11853 protein n=1 Tax=Aphanomyces stellatus TaxID=120398 RepID=A0A485KUI3_9STRA|nr:hypothetical protein As57867_011808 [Aphanomyces stellatus]VFT88708.1 Aste57867_11853 [Aphanomyces stellatus]